MAAGRPAAAAVKEQLRGRAATGAARLPRSGACCAGVSASGHRDDRRPLVLSKRFAAKEVEKADEVAEGPRQDQHRKEPQAPGRVGHAREHLVLLRWLHHASRISTPCGRPYSRKLTLHGSALGLTGIGHLLPQALDLLLRIRQLFCQPYCISLRSRRAALQSSYVHSGSSTGTTSARTLKAVQLCFGSGEVRFQLCAAVCRALGLCLCRRSPALCPCSRCRVCGS
mmetsp:Transcript_61224/g.163818  ORF Transcript_61224/g.163818 Transcript_61224/m.163818 type:complete len:226 (-) Transcript_61224:759-1436(-)